MTTSTGSNQYSKLKNKTYIKQICKLYLFDTWDSNGHIWRIIYANFWEYRYTVNNQQKISSLNAIMSIFKKQRGDIIRPALQPSHNKRKISIKMTFNMNTWKETWGFSEKNESAFLWFIHGLYRKLNRPQMRCMLALFILLEEKWK